MPGSILTILVSLSIHPLPPYVSWNEYLFDQRNVSQSTAVWEISLKDNPFLPGLIHLIPPIRSAS